MIFRMAIERGVILAVGVAMICLFGLVALFRVPVQMTPNLERPVISVRTVWPGATPQDIEAEIVIEQEKYLRRLQGLQKMTSSSKPSRAVIDLEFAVNTPIQVALIRVNNALSQVANYPENVDPPALRTSSNDQQAFIFFQLLALNPSENQFSTAELTRFLEKYIRIELERVPGVSEVRAFAPNERQVHVTINPSELAARGITIAELRNAVRNRNRDISGGDIESGKRRYQIRTIGRYESLEEIADTIIAQRDGVPVKLRDVGDVHFASQQQTAKGFINGQPSFPFGIVRTPGANVVDVLDGVLAKVDQLNKGVLDQNQLKIFHYADDVKYVKEAISAVQKNLLLGALLACVVLYLFLHSAAPTLLGALGVPICTIGALLGLLITGRTLNVISLAGVAFAIGMTLDNSIVVLENIVRHRALGKKPYTAAIDAVSEVWPAVLASTLTTIFVFSPIVLIQDEVGQLYSDIAIAISSAIIMSMFVAISVIPSIAARLPARIDQDISARPAWLSPLAALAQQFEKQVLSIQQALLNSKTIQFAVVGGTLLVSLGVSWWLMPSAEYLPEGEEAKIFTVMLAPPGYNAEEIERASRVLEDTLLPALNPDKSSSESINDVPPLKYVMRVARAGSMFSISEPVKNHPDHADALKKAITDTLGDVPGMITFANRGSIFSDNSGGSRSIQLDIMGPDLNLVYDAALQTFQTSKAQFPKAQIRPIPGLTLSQPSIDIIPNWQRANELGISTGDLGYAIWALADGAYLDDYFYDDEKIDIYLYGNSGYVSNPSDIEQLPIHTPSGKTVPLSAIADVKNTVSAETIRRVDGRRAVSLRLVPPREIALEDAVEQVHSEIVEPLLKSGSIDQSVQIQLAGASDKLQSARNALSSNFIVAVALSYLLMVAIFSHWGYPLIILLNLPLGICGGIIGLWFMKEVVGVNLALDMITMLGMVVLIGTVVNNPILLLDQTRRLLRSGQTKQQAIYNAIKIRLRPIMMSTLTTVFGLSPVVFLAGAGTELYRGLGAIVLFGLMFSTLLTLTFMPAVMALSLKENPHENLDN